MAGLYLYLCTAIIIFCVLAYKVIHQKKVAKKIAQECEDNVFYDAVKDIRRD